MLIRKFLKVINILDYIFSFNGSISRKKYVYFFLVFSVLFFFILLLEISLGGLIYLTITEKFLRNLHFLFFPIVLLFFLGFGLLSAFFISYLAFSMKRARDFSDNPISYVCYYTIFILLIIFLLFIGKFLNIIKLSFLTYFLFFLPYLIFEKNK